MHADPHKFVLSLSTAQGPSHSLRAGVLFSEQGQRMSVVHEEPSDPRPDRLHHGRVQLVEVGDLRNVPPWLSRALCSQLSPSTQSCFLTYFVS